MRALRLLLAGIAFAAMAADAAAQTIVTSQRPTRVSVSIYRDQQRADRPMNLHYLNGYALVSETRTIDIPAGEADIRFEGVAGGIIPQSAIVTGLPDGVEEKNQDAYLLSPSSLIERSLGRRVHLRRTSRATGEVREHDATIRSGAGGAVVLQTAEGFEALRCSGLPETVVYDRVPPGLSARPTLSVRTTSRRRARATVTLSYLASGFDWQADYVATLSPSGDRAELFAWVTLANGDETSFVNAQTQAIAGRINRTATPRMAPQRDRGIALRCWPQGTTSDIPHEEFESEEIVVTGSRMFEPLPAPVVLPVPPAPPPPPAMMAQQEELGDVKLYRIPEPVTVAANSQKQVAFLQRSNVEVEIVYRGAIVLYSTPALQSSRFLVTRNRTEEGLGIPLPAGRLVLFGAGASRPLLLGEGAVTDRAVGEDVEVPLGPATGVMTRIEIQPNGEGVATVTNDRNVPVAYEAMLPHQDVTSDAALGRRNGMPLWRVTVPANGTATLRWRPAGAKARPAR